MADYYEHPVVTGTVINVANGNAIATPKVTYRVIEETATQCHIVVHEAIYISGVYGFQGTTMAFVSNHGNIFNGGGIGTMQVYTSNIALTNGASGDISGHFRDIGWLDRGSTLSLRAQASYTGSSNTYYHCLALLETTVPTNYVLSTPQYLWRYDSSGVPRKVTSMYIYI